jgi:hypothetical protein
MIVNYTPDGWEVITQRSHGLLAMQLGMEWKQAARPQRWAETLLAIAEHDDAEVELDGEHLLTPRGGPLNFDMKQFLSRSIAGNCIHCQLPKAGI